MPGKSLLYPSVCALFFLGGCNATIEEQMAGLRELMYWGEKPVKIAGPVQEQWCYRTLGRIECYKSPQMALPERLVGVYPPEKQPATREEYAQALIDASRRNP